MHVLGINMTHTTWNNQCNWTLTKKKYTTCIEDETGEGGMYPNILGEFTPFYILHTCACGAYLLGGYLPCRKDYKVMVFYM